jgi:TolB-like protein
MAFGGGNLREELARQAAGQPTPIAELRPEVPAEVIGIVRRAIAKRPEDRYQTAAEMATDLRLALGEPARQSTSVVTPVEEWREPVSSASGMGGAWGRALLAAAVLVLLALGVTRFRASRTRTSAPPPKDASIAVLPFATRGGGVEDEYLGDGLSREVLDELAQVRQLEVAAPASVGALKRRRLTVRQIADTLHVRHVLDGSLERRGEQIDVRLRLIDARRDRVLWQQAYRLRESDLLRMHEVVARQVAGVLLARGSAVAMPGAGRHTARPAAHDAYLKGVYWLDRRTPDGLRLAVAAFGDALAQDPEYPQALAGLAAARTYRIIYGYRSEADPYSELAEALQLADRAIALDSTVVEGYLARADARSVALADEDSVRADVAAARRLRPHSADVAMAWAFSLFRSGAADSALAEARRAVAQDPLAPGLRHGLVALAIGTRHYDVALRELGRVRPDSGDPVAAILRGYAELLSGDAVGCAARDPGPWVAVRAMCLLKVGRAAEGAALADSLAGELDGEQYAFVHQYADLAAYYAWRGDAAGTVRWLERSLAHSPMLHRWQLESGLFDRVRSRPEFQAALARAVTEVRARLAARRAALGAKPCSSPSSAAMSRPPRHWPAWPPSRCRSASPCARSSAGSIGTSTSTPRTSAWPPAA